MDALKQIGLNIRILRIRRGITQEQLAVEAGVERSYMGGVERGQRNMSVRILIKVMAALNCSPMAVFEEVDLQALPDN